MVTAGLASRCQVSLAYAIGVAEPVMIAVDTFGTGKVCADDCLASNPTGVWSDTCPDHGISQTEPSDFRQLEVFEHFEERSFLGAN